MKYVSVVFVSVMALCVPATARAQPASMTPGHLEVSVLPAGGTFFTAKNASPSFGNFTLGGAVTYNVTPWIGVEGEITGALGVSQQLQFSAINASVKTPNMVGYSGDVVVSLPTGSSVTPYAVGGIGGLTVLDTAPLGIAKTETLFSSNVGGGLRWYASHRWGLRADYRFVAIQQKDDGAPFIGRETRYGHRVYGAVIVNILP